MNAVAEKLGFGTEETVCRWVRQGEIDALAGREARGSSPTRPATATLVRLIENSQPAPVRAAIGRRVDLVQLAELGIQIAASTYYDVSHAKVEHSTATQRDEYLAVEVARVQARTTASSRA